MTLSAGAWLLHRAPVYAREPAERVAALLTDARWPWQPSTIRPTQRAGHAVYPWPRGKVARSALQATVLQVFTSELSTGIDLVCARTDAANHAWAHVYNGRLAPQDEDVPFPLESVMLCRAGAASGDSVDAWLGVVRDLAALTHAVHGVVWVGDDEAMILARQYLMGRPQPRLAPDHPANESDRVRRARRDLGDRYVRLPGWATFLRSAHVDAIGGRARLLAAVEPPVVHELGDLLYVQLSATVADALAPATEARRRALADLLAPITVPVVAA